MNILEEEKQSEFITECQNLMEKIHKDLKWYTEEYKKMQNEEISLDQLIERYENKLLKLTYIEQLEINYMNKMLSTKNCWYIAYETGKILHDLLIKIWYPENKN